MKGILTVSALTFALGFAQQANSLTNSTTQQESVATNVIAQVAPLDFKAYDYILNASVFDMGPSTRQVSQMRNSTGGQIGTKLRNSKNPLTIDEGNRFSFELISGKPELIEKVTKIREDLEKMGGEPTFASRSKEDRLAYWLNLHNLTVIEQMLVVYPVRDGKRFFAADGALFNDKILTVGKEKLSLHEIVLSKINPELNIDGLAAYGLFQGIIGGPDIQKNAFTAANVKKLLTKSASYFVNSNRGVSIDGADELEVSAFYSKYAALFPATDIEFKAHLEKYADEQTKAVVASADSFRPKITDWNLADLYGSQRTYGAGVAVNEAALAEYDDTLLERAKYPHLKDLSNSQFERITRLMRVRAENLGRKATVTVTDLPNENSDSQK